MDDWQDLLASKTWSAWLNEDVSAISILRTSLVDVISSGKSRTSNCSGEETVKVEVTDTLETSELGNGEKRSNINNQDTAELRKKQERRELKGNTSKKKSTGKTGKSQSGDKSKPQTPVIEELRKLVSGKYRKQASDEAVLDSVPNIVDVPLHVSRRVKNTERQELSTAVIVPPGRSQRSNSLFGSLISKDFMV